MRSRTYSVWCTLWRAIQIASPTGKRFIWMTGFRQKNRHHFFRHHFIWHIIQTAQSMQRIYVRFFCAIPFVHKQADSAARKHYESGTATNHIRQLIQQYRAFNLKPFWLIGLTSSSVFWLSKKCIRITRRTLLNLIQEAREERVGKNKTKKGVHITLNPTNLYMYMKLRANVINNIPFGTAPGQKGSDH
jgi:hypothetical protein